MSLHDHQTKILSSLHDQVEVNKMPRWGMFLVYALFVLGTVLVPVIVAIIEHKSSPRQPTTPLQQEMLDTVREVKAMSKTNERELLVRTPLFAKLTETAGEHSTAIRANQQTIQELLRAHAVFVTNLEHTVKDLERLERRIP